MRKMAKIFNHDGFTLLARVAYQPEKGQPQGQQPLHWIAEGLLDAVIPRRSGSGCKLQ